MQLPFKNLGNISASKETEKSDVFQFRDKCFEALKNITLDIRYAENFWLLEERLKKVDTIDKAKGYSNDEKSRQVRGLLGGRLAAEFE